MLANTGNFDRSAKGDHGLSVPVIRPRSGHDEQTENSEAECDSSPLSSFMISPVEFLRQTRRGDDCVTRTLYAVGFTRDLQPESPACFSQSRRKVVRGPVSSMGIYDYWSKLIAMSFRVLGERREPPGRYLLRVGPFGAVHQLLSAAGEHGHDAALHRVTPA